MPLLMILFSVVTLWYCTVILILLRGLLSLSSKKQQHENRFTVVIAARNEEHTIAACLASVFNQSIPATRYEVIVVDDRSTDKTASIVQSLCKQYPALRLQTIISTPQGLSPKKYAVAQGVERAENEIVVFTDADCVVPFRWLETIDRCFSEDVGLVQGITSYYYEKGMNAIFFGLQALDFISHGVVAASAIGAGIPLNSNANNFAVRISAFRDAGGMLKDIGHVVSGDDDLLLQKVWRQKKWKIRYMIESSGAVATKPTTTAAGVFQQRARWGSKTVHYNALQTAMLTGIFLFYIAIITSLAMGIFNKEYFVYTAMLMVIKFCGEATLMVPGLYRFKHTSLLPLLPLASLLQLPLVVCAVLSGIFWKFNWKGQTFSRTIKT